MHKVQATGSPACGPRPQRRPAPRYTCHGPLGGAQDTDGELERKAAPDDLECPACEHQRHPP